MNINLDKKGLITLVNGSYPHYNEFDNLLVKKAGHSYSDQYGRTDWSKLNSLTEDELYRLYLICRNSWEG
ncbi:hypothetical protein G1K66_12910 [Tenacibaculum finnmarkense]|uniref:hypothetical protein n=1 Tax=Tenacibaculum finnmarkense TaxID=2781243 RepID=UPI001EFB2AE5|nr:hypothetical protein [Tenacibaculum finnmarkense]MCG8786489.1 hypothetical protein [Tenacibaculum finnmarkense]MCG8814154.1 hypothetical protein [Tenacibaculum finnmarkense]